MPKALLLYNPYSGQNRAGAVLDIALEKYQNAGWVLDIHRSNRAGDIPEFFAANDLSHYDAFIAAGGDGTVNETITGMRSTGTDKPLGILACGTVNDFAAYLQLPTKPGACIDLFLKGKTERVDIGTVNGRYFLNVCALGLFSHGYMSYNRIAKKMFGKYAYYTKAGLSALTFEPVRLRLTSDSRRDEGLFTLVLVLNSTGTGGFRKIAPKASASDGLLDVVAVGQVPLSALPQLFTKLNAGKLGGDPHVLHFQTAELFIECFSTSPFFSACDLDGDRGPAPPLSVSVDPAALEMYSARQ
jgi:YegS/Rv2252/BmrU family lipid kinase